MLSIADNELMCRVSKGTAMGDVICHYWLPAFLSSELPSADGDPLRIRLLGENLIAFRDTSGRVGLLANSCPHRGASLFYARNEDNGLRCVYHGWKFDVTGACVDMPSEPPESNFKDKVRATAYPCQERNGVVWTYMGTRKPPGLPPLPSLEANMINPEQARNVTYMRDCNYVQALEGDIDTAHLGFLHLGAIKIEETTPKSFTYYGVADRAPRYSVIDTECGTMYAAYRPAEEDTYYYRFAQFLMPFYTMIPTNALGEQVFARAWVPIDDDHTMVWTMSAPATQGETSQQQAQEGSAFVGTNNRPQTLPPTTGWLGRGRLRENAANDYMIDRDVQRAGKNGAVAGSFTGISNVPLQDQAITESTGTIYQRNNEHLGTSDSMIIKTRRRLINAAKAWREANVEPPGVDEPQHYAVRSGGVIVPRDVDWMEATEEIRRVPVS
jgi:phenylpropionate dioxygenase-like ring-hydroxylating dioxygenase large terminal subunit